MSVMNIYGEVNNICCNKLPALLNLILESFELFSTKTKYNHQYCHSKTMVNYKQRDREFANNAVYLIENCTRYNRQ